MAEVGGEVVRLSVKVEDAFRREVKARAARRGLTLKEYVRDALERRMSAEDGEDDGARGGGGGNGAA